MWLTKSGKPHGNRGRVHTAETRRKVSEAGKGRKQSAATKAKRSASLKGRVFSKETLAKMALAKVGLTQDPAHVERRVAPLRGRKASAQTRARLSASRTPEIRTKAALVRAELNRKRVWTAEMREKQAIALIGRLPKTSGTGLELAVERRLREAGRRFETQVRLPEDRRHVWDFVLHEERLLIEADGCYWHGCESCGHPGIDLNKRADLRKNAKASELGWRLLRVKECEVNTHPLL